MPAADLASRRRPSRAFCACLFFFYHGLTSPSGGCSGPVLQPLLLTAPSLLTVQLGFSRRRGVGNTGVTGNRSSVRDNRKVLHRSRSGTPLWTAEGRRKAGHVRRSSLPARRGLARPALPAPALFFFSLFVPGQLGGQTKRHPFSGSGGLAALPTMAAGGGRRRQGCSQSRPRSPLGGSKNETGFWGYPARSGT